MRELGIPLMDQASLYMQAMSQEPFDWASNKSKPLRLCVCVCVGFGRRLCVCVCGIRGGVSIVGNVW